MLETVLFSGQSSRIYQRLVDKDQIALSVGGGSDFAFDPTLFEVSAQPKAGVDPATVEKAIYEELARVASDGARTPRLRRPRTSCCRASTAR